MLTLQKYLLAFYFASKDTPGKLQVYQTSEKAYGKFFTGEKADFYANLSVLIESQYAPSFLMAIIMFSLSVIILEMIRRRSVHEL